MFIGACLRKLLSAFMAVVLIMLSIGAGSAEVVYVEPGDSIQAAVNNSTSGDIIVVKAGEYQENVIINVPGVTVTSEPDNPCGVLLRAMDENLSVLHLAADNITIQGFNITGSGKGLTTNRDESSCLPAGICLENSDNCTIEENKILENKYGIYLQNSRNNTISENYVCHNGIWLDEGCSQNLLINNEIEKGDLSIGAHCWNNTMLQNRISNGTGISIACCGGNNLISANDIRNCSTGIDIYDVQARTVLSDNKISDCGNGLYFVFVFDSRVNNNTISNCSTGISVKEECHYNELTNNTVAFCHESGLHLLDFSSENHIYNNYFNNFINVTVENTEGNIWNTTQISGTSIIQGPCIGGNYWANPNGTGFSEISNDSNSDGICDLPYNISRNDFDYLPLVKPSDIPDKV